MDQEEALIFAAKVFSASLLILLAVAYGGWSIWNGSYMICSSDEVASLENECRGIEKYNSSLVNVSDSQVESSEGRAELSEELGISRRGVRKIINRYYSDFFRN